MLLLLCVRKGDFRGQSIEFLPHALDLALHLDALRTIYLDGGASQSPVGPAGQCQHPIQIAQQFGDSRRWRIGWGRGGGPLYFQKQLRLFQQPLTNGWGRVSPRGVPLSGFAAGEAVRGHRLGHASAVFQTGTRHRHQKLHRHLRRDRPATHLLLYAFGKLLHQPQPARYPAHAAIKATRQLLQAVAEALLQLRQQPAFFQRRRALRHPQRTIQHQRLGFAQ
jgi:hypothetical protein